MVKKGISVFIILTLRGLLFAENNISIDTELYNTLMRTRDLQNESYWAYGCAGKTNISVKSLGNKNVKADLSIDFNLPDISGIPVLTLQKAYVKARFPSFRLTAGKTRLSWGEGFVFNSGDIIFGSISPNISLVGSELRTETAWLTAVNIPLGRFSFIEALIKAPDMIYSENTPIGLGNVRDLGAGGRLYTKLGDIKIEAGYYFDGTDLLKYDLSHTDEAEEYDINSLHRTYLSLQGNLGVDFYLNGSVALPSNGGEVLKETAKDSLNLSFGLFHLIEIGYNNSLTLRLESVFLPFRYWKEEKGNAGSYAVLLYPEIAFAYGQNINFSVRSIFCPVDISAMITGGFSWNIFEGFNLLTYASFLAGDDNDTFSWSKDNWTPGKDTIDGVSFMAGLQYIY